MITKLFERVQKRVEGFYFDARRNTFEFDNVLNGQRERIYAERNRILDGEDVHEQILKSFPDMVGTIVSTAVDPMANFNEWDLERANNIFSDKLFGTNTEYLDKENTEGATYNEIFEMVLEAVITQYTEKIEKLKEDGFDFSIIERDALLSFVDRKWVDHIDAMVQLRNGIGLRGYGGKDPIVEYRKEAIVMFNEMVENISFDTAVFLFKVKVEKKEKPTVPAPRKINVIIPQGTVKNYSVKKEIRGNDPCPCGSGKKYKNCCGKK
jgi:preprotein translocase subunit SecA